MSDYGRFGSGWVPRPERRNSAINGRSLEPIAMAAIGSESGRWANMHHTSVVYPLRKTEHLPEQCNCLILIVNDQDSLVYLSRFPRSL